MQDLRTILTAEALEQLRTAYDASAMRDTMLSVTVQPYPPLGPWNEAIAATFYDLESPLAPIDRERCLIALLAHSRAHLSLAVHVYWGLMEGLSVREVCHIVGLAACYAGIASLGNSYPVVERVLKVLSEASTTARCASLDVVQRLADEFVARQP